MNVNVSKEQLDAIKKIDIRQYLTDTLGTVFHGTNCRCVHPDHDDKSPSFSVWTDKEGNNYWCCHGCHCGKKDLTGRYKNYGTDIIGLIRWLSDSSQSDHILSFQQAAVKAMEYAGIPYVAGESSNHRDYEINAAVARSCMDILLRRPDREPYKYLKGRGLEEDDIRNWMLGFNGKRITFPLLDKDSRVVGFSNRVVGKASAGGGKYINSPNSNIFSKSNYLYGIHKIDRQFDYLYITEGQMDVIAASKYGLENVVAALGTAFTEKHLELLKSQFPNITRLVFVFDGDSAGLKALSRGAEAARVFGYCVYCVILPDGNDLYDFAMEHKDGLAKAIAHKTQFYFSYALHDEAAEYESVLSSAQCHMLAKFLPVYNSSRNTEERCAISSYLAGRFNIKLPNNEEFKHG